MKVLEIQDLNKRYGRIQAVNQLSLSIEKGMVYGILGPNGSGKTTTLGIVLGILKANSGSFQWFEGKYGDNPRRHLGALLETPNFYPYLSAVDNLDIVAHIKRVKQPRMDELLELVNLKHRKNSKFKTYSLGMKQRLAIAAAMIGDPDVLIFDEPTNGLDPQGIAEVRETLLKIASRGKTVIMASHILDEVEKVCSHVAILKNGKLLATGPIGSILNDHIVIELGCNELEKLQSILGEDQRIHAITRTKEHLLLEVSPQLIAAEINQKAAEAGIYLSHLVTKTQSLEEEFLAITKE